MADTSEFESMERSGWANSSVANAYAQRFSNATKLVAEHLSDAIKASKDQNILDLCSGHGVVAAELAARGANVTGVDFSPAMVALAESAVPDAQFVVGDAMCLAFGDDSFDAVTIGFGVPHFPDPAKGLGEVARVLKPKGQLAFSIWQGKGAAGGFGWLFEAFVTHGDPTVALPPGPDAHAFADMEVAAPALEALGFKEVSMNIARAYLIVDEPEDLFDAYDQGAVRAAVLLAGQTETARANIRETMAGQVRAHAIKTDDAWHVPVPVVIVSAILD